MTCRMFFIALLVITVTSCRMKPAVAPREPASIAEVERIARTFERVAAAHVDAWFPGDTDGGAEAVRALYTEDIVHQDQTFDAHIAGIDELAELASNFVLFFPSAETEVAGQFIGTEDSLVSYEIWDFRLEGHGFTRDDPLVEVDLLETREGLISHWRLFYGLDSIESFRASDMRATDEARALLASYASSWSSKEPSKIAGLYASDAVREDTIFGERQEGRGAIASFADSFFASYPGAQWDLLLAFGDGKGEDPMTGGVFAITVGEGACEVRTAVLLKASEDRIVHESVYYEPDSLIACGWAP